VKKISEIEQATFGMVEFEDENCIIKYYSDENFHPLGFGVYGIVFLTSLDDEYVLRALNNLGINRCIFVRDLQSLILANGHILVSFGTSIIVPQYILDRYVGGAYNIHAASPDYPGRDPHHWAVYDNVKQYGATAHIMTNKVDDGPIVDIELFEVASNIRPKELLDRSNEAAFNILSRIGPKLQRGEKLLPINGMKFGKNKRSRADFIEICKISPSISFAEFERIFHSFDGGSYNNLTIELHGKIFRIDKR